MDNLYGGMILLLYGGMVFLVCWAVTQLIRRRHLQAGKTFDEGELKKFLGSYLTSVHSPDFDVKVMTRLSPEPLTSVFPENPIHLLHGVNILWSNSDDMEGRHATIVKAMTKLGLKSLRQWAEIGVGEPEELVGVIGSIKTLNGKPFCGHHRSL